MLKTLKQVRQTSYLMSGRIQSITEKLIVSNTVRGLPHGMQFLLGLSNATLVTDNIH